MSDTQGYKLFLSYDFLPGREMAYRRFMISQWLPAMQALGLEPLELYHTMWGAYPVRLVVMYAPNEKLMRDALNSSEWEFWWKRLRHYVDNLHTCILPARDWFQFCDGGSGG